MKSKLLLVVVGILCLMPVLTQADYPEREITVYIGSGAGGVTDMGMRLLSETVSKMLGQPIVVLNKPGAGHSLCAKLIAGGKPDGYLIGALSSSPFSEAPHLRKVPYDPKKDFTWIATYAGYPAGLAVKADSPWKTLAEFIEYAKKNPGKAIYASPGHGTSGHILMEYIAVKNGRIDWKHVPISGGPKQATALLGGHIHAWVTGGFHAQFVRDGSMRLLATFTQNRVIYAPDVPTLQEAGYPNVPPESSMLIIGPKGLPDPIRRKLEEAYLKAMKEPAYTKLLEKVDYPPRNLGSKETASDIERASKAWGEMIQLTGIKAGAEEM